MIVNKPLVSICIPTYNGSLYLKEALESVRNQTYPHLEIVISDDASIDGTLEIVAQFSKELDHPIHVFNHLPQGIGANWNHCIRNARGAYIKFLFQDDTLHPTCVEEMVTTILQHDDCKMVACQRDFIRMNEMNDLEIDEWIQRYKNLQHQFPAVEGDFLKVTSKMFAQKWFKTSPLNKIGEPICVLFERALVDELGYFDEKLEQILDYEYWYRVLAIYPIVIIKKDLVSFRIHKTQTTNINRSKKIMDYELYDELLYKDYYKLLHPILQYKLRLKFHKPTILWNKIKRKFKSLFK